MHDSNPSATFSHAAEKLGDLGIAYLHVVESRPQGTDFIVEHDPVTASNLRPDFAAR